MVREEAIRNLLGVRAHSGFRATAEYFPLVQRMNEHYAPSTRSRLSALVIIVPGSTLCFWAGVSLTLQGHVFVGAAFVLLGILLILRLVYGLTMRVDMNAKSIIRSWLFGRRAVPIYDIHRLSWGGGRGQLFLSIHYDKKCCIQLGSTELAKEELRKIQLDILAIRGLEGEPLWPRMAEYVDIDKMIERKPKS